MPKIIENVREMLLCETKRQIREKGYAQTTVRSVAGACGLGVGTVYNYFKSKDMLIASFMVEEWQTSLCKMQKASNGDAESVVRCIYNELRKFSDEHSRLFSDKDAAQVFAAVFAERHKMLRTQLADILMPICTKSSAKNKHFLTEFIAESLLTWTVSGAPYEEISSVIFTLLK